MPPIVHGNIQGKTIPAHVNHDYDYPDGLNLKPGTELHDEIVRALIERATLSATHMGVRYGSWNKIDQFLTAYKRVDSDEADVLDDDDRKPVSIVFPYSYAILETLLSYMIAAFFRDPIFRYEGYSPDDVMGAIMLEQVVNLHCNKFKVMLNLHTQFRDAFSYGFGAVIPTWHTTSNGLYQGNALENIDPYLYLPDPNVPINRLQDGEYVSWISDNNYMDLLAEENNGVDLFNVKYLREIVNKRTGIKVGDSSNRTIKTGETKAESHALNGLDELFMYIKIIPSEWGVGDSDKPEKWFFRLASDCVLISARPAGFDHDKFPIGACAPDFDGYSSSPLSRLEILSGLQGTLDWLFNSHIANVRKAINDMIIYDPFLVNSSDLRDPKPGKLIRIRRPGWGKGIQDSIKQLQVNDITRANIADSSWIVDWMQKIGATDDTTMGSLRSGGPERLTKAEFQGTASGAVSRLERIAKIIGLQSMQDIGEFFASHTQQMMTDDMFVKVTGDWSEVLMREYGGQVSRGRLKITPRDLDVFYDVIVRDGTIPGSNFSEVWVRMFETIVQVPELAQSFDIVKIFKHIARNSGAKNVNEFVRRGGGMTTSTMPDEDIENQVQKGNLVPLQGGQSG